MASNAKRSVGILREMQLVRASIIDDQVKARILEQLAHELHELNQATVQAAIAGGAAQVSAKPR